MEEVRLTQILYENLDTKNTVANVSGLVGFTGSGKTMSKDPTRSRHIYQVNEELD